MVVADISPAGSIEKFRKDFPGRFINAGVAEQSMIGLTAGMAQRGLKPFAYTIATFALFRPFEFIRDDLCYQNLPVTIVGIGGGWTYSTLGATHHAQEDIVVAYALPNMNIIAPCDPHEVEAATKWCALESQSGPTYLRLGKSGEPDLTSKAIEPWIFGKIRLIIQGERIAIVTYGSIANLGEKVQKSLKSKGLNPSLYFASTLKPFDFTRLVDIFEKYEILVVVEEHIPFGGLNMIIKSFAYESSWNGKLITASLPHDFSHSYGNHAELLHSVGLNSIEIVDSVLRIL
jgi:transketolase